MHTTGDRSETSVCAHEQLGAEGWKVLEKKQEISESRVLTIGDAKCGDISSTGAAYAVIADDGPLACDSVTLNPWMCADNYTVSALRGK